MIPFHLITGFLGSGKTTLLQNILHQLGSTRRVAVIQNEFAPTGVDGKILSADGSDFHLTEINNGSVFCVCQLNTFVSIVQKLVESYAPDVIFLESSGMADPISVAELLQLPGLNTLVRLGGIFTLVDAFNFERGLAGLTRFKHQVMVADRIILNKTDLVDGNPDAIKQKIKAFNPFSEIVETSFAKVQWSTFEHQVGYGQASRQFVGRESEGRPDTKALVLRSHQKISKTGLTEFIDHLRHESIRIKGFVNILDGSVLNIQTVYGHKTVEPAVNYMGQTEIVVFTNTLTIVDLRKIFKLYADNK